MLTNNDVMPFGEFWDKITETRATFDKYMDKKRWQWKLLNEIASMFHRDGFPADFADPRVIEPILLLTGCGAYVRNKKTDRPFFGICKTIGEPNKSYIGRDAVVTAGGGYCETFTDWENNPDIVVCWNTPTRLPDLDIWRTASELTEIDISLLCNLLYSRVYPIGVANDDKMRLTLEELFKKMKIGEYATVTSSNMLQELTGKDSAGISVVNLTDPTISDKIQYLAKYHDDQLRWFHSYYGQNVQATSKMAQESVAESTSGEGVSMILPHFMYHERQREVEQLKKKFGWNVTCEFSEPWQNAFADCASEDGTADTAEKGVNDGNNNDVNTVSTGGEQGA